MNARLALVLLGLSAAACSNGSDLTAAERNAIAKDITAQVTDAYDLSKSDVERRLLSLYPPTGRVISAAGGRVLTTRDSLEQGIKYFWRNVGVNMREPKWIWDQMLIDVLARDAAAMTATYHIPHRTPRGDPHVIAGAWTAVFQKRGGHWYVIQEHLSDLPDTPPAVTADSTAKAKPPAK